MDIRTFQDDINEKLEKGYIRTRMIFEIVGKPKEHVEETLHKYIEEISKVNDIIEYEFLDVEETEDKFFSAVAQVEFLLKDVNQMFHLSFQYMPSSIEILDPEIMTIKNFDLTSVANTLQGSLHSLDYNLKLEKQKNIVMSNNIARLIRNFVNYLRSEDRKVSEIEKITGVSNYDIKKIFDEFEKSQKKNIKNEEGNSSSDVNDKSVEDNKDNSNQDEKKKARKNKNKKTKK